MDYKKHYKLYKSGKLWCTAAIVAAGLAFGAQTGHAATNNQVQAADQQAATTTLQVQSSASSSSAQSSQSDNAAVLKASAVEATTRSANAAANDSQTAVNNKMPADTTTTNNQVSANDGHLDGTSMSESSDGQAQLTVNGWHANGSSQSEPYRYMILYDNTENKEVSRQAIAPQQRDDVQKAYPNVAGSQYAGFNVTFTLPQTLSNHSLSVIDRYSNDPIHGEGSRTDYWFGPIYIDQTNRGNLDGISSSDGKVTVSGWHANNKAMGKKYHYIIAYDQTQNREIARQLVTNGRSREDVAKAYPDIFNAADSGFNVSFDLTSQYANDNIQYVSRWTDDPAGNGNDTVDLWFAPVLKYNRGNLDSWSISNGTLQVAGWHADDASVYEPYHYLIVFDKTTNQEAAIAKVDLQDSADVAKVYPDTRTAGKSRFNYDFSNFSMQSGHTYALLSRYSLSSTGDGSSASHTDYWYPDMVADSNSAYSIDGMTTNGNQLHVNGWFANSQAAGKNHAFVILLDNGNEVDRKEVQLTTRSDVANAYPHLYNSLTSGFSVDLNLPSNPSGDLQLVLRFSDQTDGEGNKADIWTKTYPTNAGSFDSINVTASSVSLSGWHAAYNTSDKPYQYIIALDASNNQELGRWNITNNGGGQSRNDVYNAYPYLPGAGNSGFSLTINPLGNLSNHFVKFIHRYTDDAAGNGNYVDYYSQEVSINDYQPNMYANSINAYIANNNIGHANIQTYYVIPEVTGAYNTVDGKPNMVVVHETANPNDSIWGEINYEKQTYENAFVHAFVDGNNIIEISPTDRKCWGAGPKANARAVQFEQVEVYGASNFARELVNAAYYTAYNLRKYNLPATLGPNGAVWSHHMVSQNLGGTDHTDPDAYWARNASRYFGTSYTMSDFIQLVQYEYMRL